MRPQKIGENIVTTYKALLKVIPKQEGTFEIQMKKLILVIFKINLKINDLS